MSLNHRVIASSGCYVYTYSSVSEMTYTVSSGTFNSTIPYHTVYVLDEDQSMNQTSCVACSEAATATIRRRSLQVVT